MELEYIEITNFNNYHASAQKKLLDEDMPGIFLEEFSLHTQTHNYDIAILWVLHV